MTQRQWIDHQTHEVDTLVGKLKVVISGGSSAYENGAQPMHAYVRTHPYEVNRPDTQLVRINGVDYCAVSIWLEQAPTSLWALTKDGMASSYHSIGGRRYEDAYPTNDLTDSARKYLLEKVVPEVETWLLTHPELVDEARRASAQQNAHMVEKTLAEAEDKARALRDRLASLDAIAAEKVPA